MPPKLTAQLFIVATLCIATECYYWHPKFATKIAMGHLIMNFTLIQFNGYKIKQDKIQNCPLMHCSNSY